MKINEISSHILGQEDLVRDLKLILKEIIERGRHYNILLVGASGMGKSHIATIIANAIRIRNCVRYDPESFTHIEEDKSTHFFDEVHLLRNPERLYPIMDSGNYTFILSTNEYGGLKEPLANRCITFFLRMYTDSEMALLSREFFMSEGFYSLPIEFYKSVAWVSRDNPRRCKEIVTRLSILFRDRGVPSDIDSLDNMLLSLDIGSGGITSFDNAYMEFLSSVGKASISTICSVTQLDKDFVLKYIEPFLIKKGLISITSGGRIVNNQRS